MRCGISYSIPTPEVKSSEVEGASSEMKSVLGFYFIRKYFELSMSLQERMSLISGPMTQLCRLGEPQSKISRLRRSRAQKIHSSDFNSLEILVAVNTIVTSPETLPTSHIS